MNWWFMGHVCHVDSPPPLCASDIVYTHNNLCSVVYDRVLTPLCHVRHFPHASLWVSALTAPPDHTYPSIATATVREIYATPRPARVSESRSITPFLPLVSASNSPGYDGNPHNTMKTIYHDTVFYFYIAFVETSALGAYFGEWMIWILDSNLS